jgi:hypothetical protein
VGVSFDIKAMVQQNGIDAVRFKGQRIHTASTECGFTDISTRLMAHGEKWLGRTLPLSVRRIHLWLLSRLAGH